MKNIEQEIDRLYQLPVDEFTHARDALAKQAGAHGAAIKKLQKPNKPAWAVNQLYWTRRPAYDRLVRAASALRDAHARLVRGGNADVRTAEAAHQDALKAASDEVRGLLRESNEPPTQAVMNAIVTTLQALPAPGPAGRLIRPLSPLGFEALATLSKGGARILSLPPRTSAQESGRKSPAPAANRGAAQNVAQTAAVKREAAAAKQLAASLRTQLTKARGVERDAQRALDQARAKLTRTEAQQSRIDKQAQAIGAEVGRLSNEIIRLQREAGDAVAARTQLEHRVDRLKS